MPFLLIRDDITKVRADAIVNPANESLTEGRGTSCAVFTAAGERLLTEACQRIGHCDPGKAVITEGFHLPASYIIHAVGPVWQGGNQGEEEILYSAYMESMKLAGERHLGSVAFPLLSSGSYGYPKEEALETAVSAIRDFLAEHEMTVYLVVYDAKSLAVSQRRFAHIEEYIDEHYVEENDEDFHGFTNAPGPLSTHMAPAAPPPSKKETADKKGGGLRKNLFGRGGRRQSRPSAAGEVPPSPPPAQNLPQPSAAPARGFPPSESPAHNLSPRQAPQPDFTAVPRPMQATPAKKIRLLDDIMLHMGETFSQMLLRLIDERGLADPDVYHKANIDRKLFSKIRTNVNYSPTKKTVMAFAIAMELSLDETKDLLQTAGYSLSSSSRSDVIISFFLENQIYDIFEINEMLFYYGQPILGG